MRSMSVAALVGLFACLAILACGGEESRAAKSPGEELFASQGCVACHGPKGQGTRMGPPLNDIAQHWTRDDLVRYFADPESFTSKDERLAGIASRFAMRMPKSNAPEDKRLLLADHVLSFP
jgi:mono/diheme cytochrome c family protein